MNFKQLPRRFGKQSYHFQAAKTSKDNKITNKNLNENKQKQIKKYF